MFLTKPKFLQKTTKRVNAHRSTSPPWFFKAMKINKYLAMECSLFYSSGLFLLLLCKQTHHHNATTNANSHKKIYYFIIIIECVITLLLFVFVSFFKILYILCKKLINEWDGLKIAQWNVIVEFFSNRFPKKKSSKSIDVLHYLSSRLTKDVSKTSF